MTVLMTRTQNQVVVTTGDGIATFNFGFMMRALTAFMKKSPVNHMTGRSQFVVNADGDYVLFIDCGCDEGWWNENRRLAAEYQEAMKLKRDYERCSCGANRQVKRKDEMPTAPPIKPDGGFIIEVGVGADVVQLVHDEHIDDSQYLRNLFATLVKKGD